MNIIETMHLIYISVYMYIYTDIYICMYVWMCMYVYTITCIHWYFDSYINLTQKAMVHMGLVSNIQHFIF